MRRLLPLAILLPSVLAAQAPAERRFLDSVLVAMAVPGGEAVAAARCAGREASLGRLCEGLVATRRAEVALDRGAASRARDLLDRVVSDRGEWPVAWYALGIARLQAARVGVLSREGPLHPVGVSNEAGGAAALIRALELDTTYRDAARALALASIPREGASRVTGTLAVLKTRRALLDAPSLYGAGLMAVEVGDGATAIEFLNLALNAPDTRPGLVSLALARAYYQNGEMEAGTRALLEGAEDSAVTSVRAYRRELAWVADAAELKEWDAAAPAGRAAFLADFWGRRDVRDARPAGSRLREHYARMEVAYKEFRKLIPQVGEQKAPGTTGAFDYFADEMMVRFASEILAPTTGDTSSAAAADNAARLAQQEALARSDGDGRTMGSNSIFRSLRSSQAVLDDRGVIWIRHGKPDKTARTADGLALEVWRYDRPEGPLLLQFKEQNFDGQVGASVLTPTLVTADPRQRDQLCHLDTTLCSMNADPRSSQLQAGSVRGAGARGLGANAGTAIATNDARVNNAAHVETMRRAGIETIRTATTTDDNRRRFVKAFAPAVQVYGLDRAEGGAPRLVVAFAVPGAELEYTTPPEAGGRAVYPVRLELMVARRGDGRRFDLDTLRRFATAAPLGEGQYLTGMVEFPLPAGTYTATAVLSQGERGSTARVAAVVVPDGRGALQLSDLVLGREGAGVRWQSGTTPVALNPLNTYPKGGTAEVYYQLAGTSAGTAYQHRIELFGADDAPGKAAQLSLAFEQRATGPRTEVTRSFGLGKVNPGRYRVRLTVIGAGSETSSTAWLTILK